MADLMSPDRDFGVTLAAGVTVGPGTLIALDSSATGALANSKGPIHGFSLTSGAGTKQAGIAQRVSARRHGILKVPNAGFTKGATLYAGTSGQIAGSGSSVTIKVGFALDTDVAYVDLDLENL